MSNFNEPTEKTSDAERIEQLLGANEVLTEANEQLRQELTLERQQLASAQLQLALLSQQLVTLSSDGTEPMMPIGDHHFDPAKISALIWERSIPELPTLCVDRIPVWQPDQERPRLARTQEPTAQERAELPGKVAAWEKTCREAQQDILQQINAAKGALLAKRRQRA